MRILIILLFFSFTCQSQIVNRFIQFAGCTALPLDGNTNTEEVTIALGFNNSTTGPGGAGTDQGINMINGATNSVSNPVTTEYCGTTTALRITADGTNTGGDAGQFYISVVNSTVYDYYIYARGDGSSTPRIQDGTGTNTDFSHVGGTDGEWDLFSGSFTANATGNLYIFFLKADNLSGSANAWSEYIITTKEQ